MPITLTHNDGTTWTSGKKGKPPTWISQHPDYIAFKNSQESIKKIVQPIERNFEMNYWRLCGLKNDRGVNDPTKVQCVVAADSKADAILEMNKVFKYAVTAYEFENMWSEMKEGIFKDKGVYELKGTDWIKR